ncbi:MAG TPA: sodium-translocating pyrophosphatase [Candidatus Pullichristensenella excrementigallinarum]|uniref:K(+)-insensitive pyrophosphate-energized proton pump n=1 Tax=Candidatus Pullichristensenella excrementigallinarum TaxID=2840907 RepID=A0A9D1I8X0_9FIRM|nr:sodium-translocating pyrophosphatase [Candidatus Pullichristensenella excrementigallinarum]
MLWTILSIVVSVAALGVAMYFYRWVKALPSAGSEIERIGKLIRDGAFTFMKREYKILGTFCGVVAAIILLVYPKPVWTAEGNALHNLGMAACYLFGATLSGTAGVIGISIATIANIRSASAARDGLAPAYAAGFRGGAVMGMAVVASSLFGAGVLHLLTGDSNAVMAFSFGASSLALFAKAGGGIFTKTADIAADLTGKVELGIPEDDPRNPAVIADNVGDNVGDVAGMGADLFDSNIASIAAAMVIAASLQGGNMIELLFCYCALGLLASILGVFMARIGKSGDPGRALNGGTYLTCGIFAILAFAATAICDFPMRVWGAAMIGMIAGVIIGFTSELFTGDDKKPVERVAKACQNGPAFTILSGISYGFLSALPSLAGIGLSALLAYKICEPVGPGYAMFGISIAAIGMLSVVGMIISNDAYGPIVDNARGLAEMCGLGDEVLEITDKLDSAGNTAKAITKGFAIGAAGLTVIALLGAFKELVEAANATINLNLMNPLVFFGALIGAAVPAVFSAMLMLGVDRNSRVMVKEIHRQFDNTPGLREGKVLPDYGKCIDIATRGAIRELIPAGLMAIVMTLLVGLIGGVNAVGGYLMGNIVSGLLLAMLMSNAGGLWDNAKKFIEAGNFGGKGSDAHKAAVIGDTVGDPFKDTAGPSINTQITVVSLTSSLAAGLFAAISLIH